MGEERPVAAEPCDAARLGVAADRREEEQPSADGPGGSGPSDDGPGIDEPGRLGGHHGTSARGRGPSQLRGGTVQVVADVAGERTHHLDVTADEVVVAIAPRLGAGDPAEHRPVGVDQPQTPCRSRRLCGRGLDLQPHRRRPGGPVGQAPRGPDPGGLGAGHEPPQGCVAAVGQQGEVGPLHRGDSPRGDRVHRVPGGVRGRQAGRGSPVSRADGRGRCGRGAAHRPDHTSGTVSTVTATVVTARGRPRRQKSPNRAPATP